MQSMKGYTPPFRKRNNNYPFAVAATTESCFEDLRSKSFTMGKLRPFLELLGTFIGPFRNEIWWEYR